MMCHMARDALFHGRNARMHHCFGDEDGMQWLKRNLAKFRAIFLISPWIPDPQPKNGT